MDGQNDLEMQIAISNMLNTLEKEIKEPLTENQIRKVFQTIHLCLSHLASNKENIKGHL